MRILKYLFFLCIVLGKYQFIVGAETSKKIKQSKSAEICPAQLPYVQKHNKACLSEIDNILGKRDRLEDEDIKEVYFKFSKMKDNTPLKSKRAITAKYMQNLQSEICPDQNVDSVEQNNQLFNAYSSPIKSKLVSTFTNILSSPEVRTYSAVDINHVLNINPIFSKDGIKLINIKGGHYFESYVDNKFIVPRNLLLIASDNKTIGFYFGDEINKTLYLGLTHDIVLDNLNFGVTLAKDPSCTRFKVSLVGNDRYVGSYQDANNPCKYLTIFPLFIVSEKNKNESGDIYVGKFAYLDSEPISKDGILNVYDEQKLFISPSNFNDAMTHGKILNSDFKDVVFVEITDQLTKFFAEDLKKIGMTTFPLSIYGIIDNREIK